MLEGTGRCFIMDEEKKVKKQSRKTVLQSLLEQGKKTGVLGYKEVSDKLEELELDAEQIEKMLAVNSDNQLYKQAGNAVTVTVIKAIGERIKLLDDELYKRRGTIYGL